MTSALTLTPGRDPRGATVLAVAGEIDMSNAGDFSAAVDSLLRDAGDGPVVVDLTAVDYIDSAGLAVLFPHIDRIRLVATDLLAPILTVVGLDDVTTIR
jgi:anti-sigma B factor antagonist